MYRSDLWKIRAVCFFKSEEKNGDNFNPAKHRKQAKAFNALTVSACFFSTATTTFSATLSILTDSTVLKSADLIPFPICFACLQFFSVSTNF
jgi:hypothetical protein